MEFSKQVHYASVIGPAASEGIERNEFSDFLQYVIVSIEYNRSLLADLKAQQDKNTHCRCDYFDTATELGLMGAGKARTGH